MVSATGSEEFASQKEGRGEKVKPTPSLGLHLRSRLTPLLTLSLLSFFKKRCTQEKLSYESSTIMLVVSQNPCCWE